MTKVGSSSRRQTPKRIEAWLASIQKQSTMYLLEGLGFGVWGLGFGV